MMDRSTNTIISVAWLLAGNAMDCCSYLVIRARGGWGKAAVAAHPGIATHPDRPLALAIATVAKRSQFRLRLPASASISASV